MNRWKVTGLWSLIISTAFGLSLLIVLTEEARSYRLSSQQHPQQPTHWLRRTPVASSTQTKMSRFQHVFPSIIYGTAWKKERTKDLVELAVRTGFRAIDTACQPKHYNEAGVGDALETLYSDNFVRREELFLQTKFTSLQGQDPAQVPYDVQAPLTDQVNQSFNKSLLNLRTSYVDSLILHSPMQTMEETLTVWNEFESFHKQGRVRYLGLSNCYDLSMLTKIYNSVSIKPTFLQNRFYHQTGYDQDIRAFCRANSIHYQSFWTLSANPDLLNR
jgi:diketogulonate reductase-like aldo/keto reductase